MAKTCYNNKTKPIYFYFLSMKFFSKKFAIFILMALSLVFCGGSSGLASDDDAKNATIKEINRQIEVKKDELKKIQEQQSKYSDAIRGVQREKVSLANQISILRNKIAKTELEISETEIEIDRVNLEIEKTETQIVFKEKQIERQKDRIGTIIRLIEKNDRVSYLEALLLNNSFSEFITQVKNLESINEELKKGVDELKLSVAELEKEKADLVVRQKEMEDLKKELGSKKIVLQDEKTSTDYILDQTKMSEKKYQNLLDQAKAEQQAAENEIAGLEKAMREKMRKIGEGNLTFNDSGFIWPVPKNTITAYFHDPDYPFRYLFEHPAIDIRAAQSTPIKAAASGYVAQAKDGGKGYSYIMLVHGDDFSTVYGHVSRIYVQNDDYVVQGQIIGLSGGMPGTPGAGSFTTGPHLHFEVRKGGLPVDPLDYLP